MAMVKRNYECNRTIREKFDVITASTEVNLASGYKMNVIGFGWTIAAYRKMQALLKNSGEPTERIAIPHREWARQAATP